MSVPVLLDLRSIEPFAVVLHQERQARGGVDQPDADRRRLGMTDRVRQRFLRDAEQRVRDVGRRDHRCPSRHQTCFDDPRPVGPGELELERLLQ